MWGEDNYFIVYKIDFLEVMLFVLVLNVLEWIFVFF